MNTQKYCTIKLHTSNNDEGGLPRVSADKDLGAHDPFNHLNYDEDDSKYWNNYFD